MFDKYLKETIIIKNRQGLEMSVRITKQEAVSKLVFVEHGFSGSKDEKHILILEEEFAKHGYIVVNLDATNSLNKSGSSAEGITFTSHYNDLEDVINWAITQNWFVEPFALAGHSMGAVSVLLYAQNYSDSVSLLLPLSFPWISGKSMIAQSNKEDMKNWQEQGYFNKVSKLRNRTLRVPYNFINDLTKYDFAINVKNIKAKTILIIGDKEDQICLDDNQKLFNMLECEKELVILPNVPHNLAETVENAITFKEALENVLTKYNKSS